MKLYTEEQVRHAIKMARSSYNIFTTSFMYNQDEVIDHLTSIELPSDEEIEKHVEESNSSLEFDTGFKYGAEWMRDKIQGGNNGNTNSN